jgi:hypothetical protein
MVRRHHNGFELLWRWTMSTCCRRARISRSRPSDIRRPMRAARGGRSNRGKCQTMVRGPARGTKQTSPACARSPRSPGKPFVTSLVWSWGLPLTTSSSWCRPSAHRASWPLRSPRDATRLPPAPGHDAVAANHALPTGSPDPRAAPGASRRASLLLQPPSASPVVHLEGQASPWSQVTRGFGKDTTPDVSPLARRWATPRPPPRPVSRVGTRG